ncbi:histidine kinase [Frankia sp. AiPs1]|uniref:sensor histidine kinase n=1 Tax=Frankia sp. AiPa1 TaxID=573492 RepID=UPI00202B14C7|nr:histidine kinase [Frankia sp. AiPa1]MCL9762834.1 histidine kinase [Frankia sp. AiPa1]
MLVVASSVAVGGLLYVTRLYPVDPEPVQRFWWVRIGLFGVICLVELLRRRAPGFALTSGLMLVLLDGALAGYTGVSLPMLVVFADLLYAATLYGSPRLSRDMVLVAVLCMFGLILDAQILVADWRATIITGLSAFPLIVLPVWLAANLRQEKRISEVERKNSVQVAWIAELDRAAAVAAERSRLARDLHDVIAGHLSAIAIQSEAVLATSGGAIRDPARNGLVSIRKNSVKALEEMRAIINLLAAQDSVDDEMTSPSRLAALSTVVESVRSSGIKIEVNSDLEDSPSLPMAVDLTAYRIAHEALTNIIKHAPRSRAHVDIQRIDGVLSVRIVNELPDLRSQSTMVHDGDCVVGDEAAASAAQAGNGLRNMRERATAVGGSFSAGFADGGWQVCARLPIVDGIV